MERETERKKDAGSIMDALNVKGIIRLAVPLGPPPLMDKFEALVWPIRRHVEVLQVATFRLRTTRDLLLPRLISGEIGVEDLDIAVEKPAA